MTEQLALNRIADACEEIAKKGGGGGGGDTVEITPTLTEGTKIAEFKINNQTGELYAPQGGGSGGGAGYTAIVTVTEVMDSNGGDNNG